jgi:hypothetical protein
MSAFNPSPTDEQLTEALDWLMDCFPDVPETLTDDEIVAAMNRHYDGGWRMFKLSFYHPYFETEIPLNG